MMNNPKAAASFRVLVAGYLIYLGGRNLLNPGAVGRNLLIVASSILFIVTGVGYALFAYKVYKNTESAEDADDVSVGESGENVDFLDGVEDVNESSEK